MTTAWPTGSRGEAGVDVVLDGMRSSPRTDDTGAG